MTQEVKQQFIMKIKCKMVLKENILESVKILLFMGLIIGESIK